MGAGVIGCEYASIFGGLGCKVELINPASGLLTFLDTEIADALSYHCVILGCVVAIMKNLRKWSAVTITS